MTRIKEARFNGGLDYILEDGTELYEMDWNTICYSQGYDPKHKKDVKCKFYPIYDEEGEIIGFKERY